MYPKKVTRFTELPFPTWFAAKFTDSSKPVTAGDTVWSTLL